MESRGSSRMTTKKVALTQLPPVDRHAPVSAIVTAGIKGMAAGTATAEQQKEVFNWIIKEAAGIGTQSFRAGDPYACAFAEGRRFVAIQLMTQATKEV